MAEAYPFSRYTFIAIGANLPSVLGDPLNTIEFAFDRLASLSAAPVRCSSIYVTEPVDSPPGTPDFFNAMAGLLPGEKETPLSMLHKLQAIEQEAGRIRSGILNEARTLDLDLVTFGEAIIQTDELTLPHPRAHERRFVLEPLMEITGKDFQLPGISNTLGEMLYELKDEQAIKKL